jgi:hypothetical protein
VKRQRQHEVVVSRRVDHVGSSSYSAIHLIVPLHPSIVVTIVVTRLQFGSQRIASIKNYESRILGIRDTT